MAVVFPRWTNLLPLIGIVGGPVAAVGGLAGLYFWIHSPKWTDVGYAPPQPVSFSHQLHAGELGMDCRYCHDTAERAAHAAIPATSTCMSCHAVVKTSSKELAPVRESAKTGEAIPWRRVHMLPDYAFFDHSVHLAAGIGCESCHGRVDQMPVLYQHEELSMKWCLDCHRNPEPHLRPKDAITMMGWEPGDYDPATDPHRTRELEPPEHCSGCHR
ncbi:MAG: cytochrome c3 family protein [Acidobacteriota bacterium]